MVEPKSETIWVQQLKAGDDDAAKQLWDRYFQRILGLARKKLGTTNRRMADEQDVAISAFHSFCQGAVASKFNQLKDRNDLWQILSMLTVRKAIRQYTRENAQKRGGGRIKGESVFQQFESKAQGIDAKPSPISPPDFIAMVEEEFSGLLDLLPDEELRQVALWKLEGYTNAEIASEIGRHERSVERKLQIIRGIWETNDESEKHI